jgi:hypothetical protein
MKTAFITLALAGLSASAASAAPIDALNDFVGTWSSSGTAVATPYGPAGALHGASACAWSNDHLFVICQQTAAYGTLVEHDITVFTYDESAKQYHFYRITPSDANETGLAYAPGMFTFLSHFKDKAGTTIYVRTLNAFTDNDHYTWRTEYSSDQLKWNLMNSGSITRAK